MSRKSKAATKLVHFNYMNTDTKFLLVNEKYAYPALRLPGKNPGIISINCNKIPLCSSCAMLQQMITSSMTAVSCSHSCCLWLQMPQLSHRHCCDHLPKKQSSSNTSTLLSYHLAYLPAELSAFQRYSLFLVLVATE